MAEAPEDFAQDAWDFSDWSVIPVLANWELEGFGTPIYVNIQYPFSPVDPPRVPDEGNAEGSYHRT
jgi:beta-galactosidase